MRHAQLNRLNSWLEQPLVQPLTASEIEDLLAPAPRTGHRSEASRQAGEARRRFHLSLLAQGAIQWNRWAEAMIALRPRLRDKAEAALFALAGHVDLSGESFPRSINLSGFSFPGGLSLDRTRFEAELYATGLRVHGRLSMREATLLAPAWLDQGVFLEACDFSGSTLDGRLEARASLYRGACAWRRVQFRKDCWFASSRFEQDADFSDAAFDADAGFGNVHFGGAATFERAVFADTLGMEGCVFEGAFNCERVAFERGVFLQSARFAEEPRIARARFVRAPLLEGATFPEAAPGAPPVEPAIRELAARLG